MFERHPVLRKWLWFIALYLAGLAAVSAIAYSLRLVIL